MSLLDWQALASCLVIIVVGINLRFAIKENHYIALILWALFVASLIWQWGKPSWHY